MSLPTFPENTNLTREDAINQIISSIAMEELGLSHIINAEGEKLQYALGIITGVSGPDEPATIEDLLELNKSIHKTLDSTMMNQFFLKEKLKNALSASIMQGPTGPAGPQGPATIGIDPAVEKLDPDASPTVENVGSSDQNVILKFGIPRGDTGPIGQQGIQGMDGPQGIQGLQGEQGPHGEQGPQGVAGPPGPQGLQGDPGQSGPTGPSGPKGDKGDRGLQGETGATGERGPDGLQGIQGKQGIPGTNGFDGITVKGDYDPTATYSINDYVVSAEGNGFVARKNGLVNTPPPPTFVTTEEWAPFVAAGAPGSQGIQGLQGIEGPAGPQGPQGLRGATGPEGPTGPQGETGLKGDRGAKGDQGLQGETGPPGLQGTQGIQGISGPQGAQGATGPQGLTGETGPAGPTGPSPVRVYKANLSTSASPPLLIPLGNAINYELRFSALDAVSLFFRPLPGLTQARCDYRIVSQYDVPIIGTTPFNVYQQNNAAFTQTSPAIDSTIYNNTREMHRTWIRVQNPNNSNLWSTYEVNLFSSQNGARVIVWVNVIDENGSY